MSKLSETMTIELAGLSATRDLAACLAHRSKCGDVLALYGDLGTGKTEFARSFVRTLTDHHEDVPSPTFTLVQTYDGSTGEIWHFDLYRLVRPEEAFELGIEDAFHDGISIIEWPERLGPYLPRDRLDVHLSISKGKNHRQVVLTPHGNWSQRLRECGHG